MGTVRFALAMLVVYYHADGHRHFGLLLPDGRVAVQLFYVISGFYMALVLNEKYDRPGMNWTFYTNRFFRLWPPMMVVAGLTLLSFVLLNKALLFQLEADLGAFIDYLRELPPAALAYIAFANVLVFGQSWIWFLRFDPVEGVAWSPFMADELHNGSTFLINHPTFTVAIEATFYLMSPFLLRRSVGWLAAIVAVAFLYHMAVYLAGLNRVVWSYHFVGSAAYFYFLGACAYHLYARLSRLPAEWPHRRSRLARFEPALYLLGVVAAAAIWHALPAPSLTMALVLAAVMPLLFHRTRASGLDRLVGDLSYGIYLVHFPLHLLLLQAFEGRTAAALTLILAVLGAIVLYFSVEAPIDRWRQRRARAAAAGSTLRPAEGRGGGRTRSACGRSASESERRSYAAHGASRVRLGAR